LFLLFFSDAPADTGAPQIRRQKEEMNRDLLENPCSSPKFAN
jgi:hypothetical protein